MGNENYYVYCKEILGVKTNLHDFKWVYGSVAPICSSDEYDQCKVKLCVYAKPEKELPECMSCDQQFQAYKWNQEQKTLFYRRTMFSCLKLGYNIKFADNQVEVWVGKNYLKFVQQRIMNLHGMYYLLSDLANMMLLKNGLLTLYASSVYFSEQKRGLACFAPPNTGKTLTVTKLCERPDYDFVGEDIVITDGEKMFACPWTSSYRKKASKFDTAGSMQRVNNANVENVCENCDLTDLIVLYSGEKNITSDKNEFLHKASILNGYLFNYYSSPIIKILGYFDGEYSDEWNEQAKEMLKKMVNTCHCHLIGAGDPLEFSKLIHSVVLGEKL